MISQNGIPLVDGVQEAIGPRWGHVDRSGSRRRTTGVPIDPARRGVRLRAYRAQAARGHPPQQPARPGGAPTIDVSPGALGDNPVGTNDGTGHPVNPVTGQPYPAELANEADFARAVAEFWADGPKSETPPGHWNVLANEVGDALGEDLRVGGGGPVVDRLEWDVKTYLALNGAVHDAAIAAWGLKGHYNSIRPISMIRYLGSLGQSSDPGASAYDPDGLPLVADLIELITPVSTRAGARHAHLAGHEGEIALRAWTGIPDDPATQTGGVDWILAVDWLPYQLPTFVTPAFPGYVSGHSAFSRAAAEVLTAMTGSPYVPGWRGRTDGRGRVPALRARPRRRRPPRLGHLSRRRRSGRAVAPVGRHPHPRRRRHRTTGRRGLRGRGLGTRFVVLRRHRGFVRVGS